MAAEQLTPKHEVHLYEKGKAIGRKFLVAGKGGFNLTNSTSGEALKNKYLPRDFLSSTLEAFDAAATREWLTDLGIPTFVGSSGRVFPEKEVKPVEVLQKWKERLQTLDIKIHLQHEFIGFSENGIPKMRHLDKEFLLEGAATIFALGGASWSVTGSKGDWLNHFEKTGIPVKPFEASNCGIKIDWLQTIKTPHAGKPIKNCSFHFQDKQNKGEVVLTDYGLEGNGIYPLLPWIRKALNEKQNPILNIDLKPRNTTEQLLEKLGNKSPKNFAKALNLNATQLALVKAFTDKTTFLSAPYLAKAIKQIPLPIKGLQPIEEAISTVGGISLEAINLDFSLKKFPSIYLIGEMLDWDAPTGGYLLQACFAMGKSMEILSK